MIDMIECIRIHLAFSMVKQVTILLKCEIKTNRSQNKTLFTHVLEDRIWLLLMIWLRRVIDCSLMQTEQGFSYIVARTSYV
jgi:hypothetical protein